MEQRIPQSLKGSKNKKSLLSQQSLQRRDLRLVTSKPGMTSVIHTFLVDEFSETYPYLPFDCSNDYARMHQDSRPRASVTSTLHPQQVHCTRNLPSDDLFEDGSWTRWSATRPLIERSTSPPGDPGLLQHPYFPDRVLWAFTTSFSWFRLDSVNRMMRTVPLSWYRDSEDTVTATKTMVDQTVLGQNEQYRLLEEMTLKRRIRRKQHRSRGWQRPSHAWTRRRPLRHTDVLHAAEVGSLQTSFDTTVNVLKDDKAAMRALLGKRAVALTRPEAKKSE
ncbi:hypothetical protein B0H14DRAFT_2812187, partial [Mycena olivaceomarginata]